MAHGVQIDLTEQKLAPPKPLQGLSESDKRLHDQALEAAKKRVMARMRGEQNGN